MINIEAVYVDAIDGRPATEAALRHGPAIPHPSLKIDMIDRTQRPARIYGQLPNGEELAAGMREVSDAEYQAAVDLIHKRRSSARLKRLAAVRYAHETGGVTVDGKSLHSDRQSQANLASARMKAKEGKAPSTWKLADGSFLDVSDAEHMVAIADAVFDFVNACFVAERDKAAAIQDGERVDLDEGWPSNDLSTS